MYSTENSSFTPSAPGPPAAGPKVKSFGPFRLDAANHSLRRGPERLSITPKSFDVLRYLVENAGRLVSQNELLEALWQETYVNPEVLRKYILEIRKALGDRASHPLYIYISRPRPSAATALWPR
jgi:DNA-binding winged helix-turn-helix (wHTH) protein